MLAQLWRRARPLLDRHPTAKHGLVEISGLAYLLRHTVGQCFPSTIRAETRWLSLAITSHCNLRCLGCRYGRDFMRGAELSAEVAISTLREAARLGVHSVRIYGGEPLVHPQVVTIVEQAVGEGLRTSVSTNGMLLRRYADRLYAAGLRRIALPLYGTGDLYDRYVQTAGAFQRLVSSLDYVQTRFGDSLQLDLTLLIAEPFCTVDTLKAAWSFCKRYHGQFHVDLVHPRFPYFNLGPDDCLRIRDPARLHSIVDELLRLRRLDPETYREPLASIRSIPDWVLHDGRMAVPCDMYEHVWVGPDGSVQLCYTAFPLGNINRQPLSELLYSTVHRKSAADAFMLKCPGCSCNRFTRIPRHLPSLIRYGRDSSRPSPCADSRN